MSYQFNSTNQYLSTASAPASGSPMTIACWFNASVVQSGVLVSVGVSSGAHRNQLQAVNGTPGVSNYINAVAAGATTTAFSFGATDVNTNTWGHAAGVFASATSRTSYTNGGGAVTNTTDCGTQNAATSIVVGARWSTTLGLYYSGLVADVGVWNVALTADEIASLAKGVACRLVRPQSLVFYAPLIRELVDLRGGLAITNNNAATVAVHPRVYA